MDGVEVFNDHASAVVPGRVIQGAFETKVNPTKENALLPSTRRKGYFSRHLWIELHR